MKVAILGANGQLGSDLAKVFGDDAIPLAHREGDVTDPESLNILKELKPEVVINTAAYVRVDDAEVEVEEAFRVNALGALHVARVCTELEAINVFISTDYVFDGAKGEPYTEDDVPNPVNVYGLSKYMGELFTRNFSFKRKTLPKKYYVVRVSSLYGKAGSSGKGGNFVEFMIQKAKNGEKINVVDDQFMSPTYTRDVAAMLKRFLDLKPAYGVYHMANQGFCSWYEFTKDIFNILDWEVDVKPIKSAGLTRLAMRPIFSALSESKLNRLGLRMRPWREALTDYLTTKTT